MEDEETSIDEQDPYDTDEQSDYEPSSSETDDETVTKQNTRKRLRREHTWKENQRKRGRASGKSYKNFKGVVVPEKVIKTSECRCSNKCNEKIGLDQSKVIFKNFYRLGSFDLQSAYLFGQVNIIPKIRSYTNNENSRRGFTRIYHLPNIDGKNIKVCKKYFKDTLQVSDGRLSRVLKSKPEAVPPRDKRGKHPPGNKTSAIKIEEVKQFINRFPVYESHYTRNKSGERKYLAPYLNISILYNLYKQDVESPVSNYVFRNTFNTFFNLHFHAPVSDSCRKCDEFENKIKVATDEEKKKMETEKELHQRKAALARKEMEMDGQKHKNGTDTAVITFDLMKTLPTPVISTGITYYKRQLWTYCLGIHDVLKNTATMYVWNESIASRGPQEIGSCLIHCMKNFVTQRKIIMYSDQCGGQNRNLKMALVCDFITTSTDFAVEEINHKFLVSGHSYLPCDQDFGAIEKEKKLHRDIYIPDHWVNVIESSRKKQPFKVVKMTREDFFSTKKLENAVTNRKISEEGLKVEWLKMQWLRYTSQTKHKFYFKYSNSEFVHFYTINVGKRCATKNTDDLELLYTSGRAVDSKKIKDLHDLLPYIPPIYHNFYRKLKTSATAVDELVLLEEVQDNKDE